MRKILALVSRNRKLFFRDKGMFFSSLITPMILIVLYATFLAKVYKDSFTSSLPEMMNVSEKLINGTVAAQLAAALLAVSCITVTFCVNLTMVQDIATGCRRDLNVTPTKKATIYLGYFFATFLNSLLVNLVALGLCLVYIGTMGWFLSALDIVLIIADIIILVLFGTVISSVCCFPLTTQGQMSAVGTIVSAGYGFVCGAYMPISNFDKGIQTFMSYLPGTYGTALIKNHMLRGVFEQMESEGFPGEVVTMIADSLDCNPVFKGEAITVNGMYFIMGATIVVFGALYLILVSCAKNK